MTADQILAEIREANLSYLMLAQSLIRTDREQALFRLGVSEETAQLIEALTPAQLMKIASGNTLLCRFRMDDDLVWGLLTSHGKAGSSAFSSCARSSSTLRVKSSLVFPCARSSRIRHRAVVPDEPAGLSSIRPSRKTACHSSWLESSVIAARSLRSCGRQSPSPAAAIARSPSTTGCAATPGAIGALACAGQGMARVTVAEPA